MSTVVVIYHTGFGHTRVQAERVAAGAGGVTGVEAKLISVDELPPAENGGALSGRWDELNDADAIIFGCPTYMGGPSAAMKAFMETSSAVWGRQGWKDKISAGFTNAGALSGDKLNTLTSLALFAAQHSMIWVSQGLFYSEDQDPGSEGAINRMGSWLGAMSQSENAPPDQTPGAADLKTAELFGTRVAEATQRWIRGG